MAIFNQSDQQTNSESSITTIAVGCRVSGKIEAECVLHVDGEFDGDIHSTNTVSIGKTGLVKSDIKAHKLVVAGKFVGNAECESIELLDGGTIEGQISSASLAIDSGGTFQGQSIRKKPADKKVVDIAAEKTSAAAKTSSA